MKLIELALAKGRDDGGKTENFRVFDCDARIEVKNRRGEKVMKNAVLGGNGTIYIANELAGEHEAWVLVPRTEWDRLAPKPTRTDAAKRASKR